MMMPDWNWRQNDINVILLGVKEVIPFQENKILRKEGFTAACSAMNIKVFLHLFSALRA